MKKRINKTIMIILAGTMALSMAGCSGPAESPKDSPTTEAFSEGSLKNQRNAEAEAAARHLLIVWSDYLGALDQMYNSELWALDYVEAYLDSSSWSDLTKARTACIASARFLTELSMSEEDLSEEEYLSLAGVGVDAGYQSTEFSALEETIEEAHSVIRNRFLEGLESDIFYESSIEILKEEAAVERNYISCMCRYVCIETNYLLLSLEDYAASDEYWSSMQEKYPILASGCDQWLSTEEELKTAEDRCLDEYEDIILRQSDLISSMNADLYRMTQTVQNRDLESLIESAHIMDNVPALLPMPEWYRPDTTGYLSFIPAVDGSISYPASGDMLPDADYGMYIQAKGIEETDITAYMAAAERYADHCWKEDGKKTWYIAMPEYNIKIDWKDDIATILFNGEDITFAPGWYIGLQSSTP